jgi:hypothetical protein
MQSTHPSGEPCPEGFVESVAAHARGRFQLLLSLPPRGFSKCTRARSDNFDNPSSSWATVVSETSERLGASRTTGDHPMDRRDRRARSRARTLGEVVAACPFRSLIGRIPPGSTTAVSALASAALWPSSGARSGSAHGPPAGISLGQSPKVPPGVCRLSQGTSLGGCALQHPTFAAAMTRRPLLTPPRDTVLKRGAAPEGSAAEAVLIPTPLHRPSH